ncbi:MAG: LURP-one-related family protein [Clostridia bacterium]|nr:LURP-one-related family protein [Clostridia bacterium]
MKYIIKNKIVSFGGSSTVRDDNGTDLFFVKGRVFTFTKHKTICDINGNTLYRVRNKFFHILLPKVFLMDADGNILVTIKKRSLFSFRQNFDFICAEGSNLNLSIEGDFIGRHYDILDNGVPVAHVRRNFNLVKDSFWLETDMEDKAALYIAIVIAIDNYYDKLQQETSSN